MKNEQDKRIKLEKGMAYFNGAAQIGEYIYYSAKNTNGLFRANLTTRKSEFITIFDTERKTDIHRFAFSVNQEVWFIPFNYGDKIAIFHVDSTELEYVDIPKPKKECTSNLFLNILQKDDYVWLVPGNYDALVSIHIKDRTTKRIDLPIGDYEEMAFTQGCEYDNKIYLCPWAHNRIVYWDLTSEEIGVIDIAIEEQKYRNIFILNDIIYLFPRDIPNDVLQINLREYECSNRKIRVENNNTRVLAIYYNASMNQMLLFPYLEERRIYRLNMDSFDVNEIKFEYDDSSDSFGQILWRDIAKLSDDTTLILSNGYILEYHNNELTPFLLECPKDLFMRQLFELMEKKEEKRKQANEQGNIGEKIYKAISSDTP